MTLLFVIDQVYIQGGIERVLSIKANALASNSANKVHIITTEQKNNTPCFHFNNAVIFQDLEINYTRNKSYFHPKNLLKLPTHIFKMRSAIKKINPDVVVVCSHSTDTFFMPFINKKIPKVKEFHFSKHIELKARNTRGLTFKKCFFKFTDFVEKNYDKLIILNKDEAKYYKTSNTIVIPNPLTFYPSSVSQFENKIVIAAGRIAPVKGYDLLIDIWHLVNLKKKDWQLHIYGNGDANYVESLQHKINSYGLETKIILKGATDNIQNKMCNASIFAMTSHNECFPLVLLEAQACGLPIISFDCPNGPRNIINESNGVLVPVNNMVQFSNKLLDLMSNKEELVNLGANARVNASNFSLDVVMQNWANMFNDVILKNNENLNR